MFPKTYTNKPYPTITVTDVAYHRNGISGAPFHVVTFIDKDQDQDQSMIGIVFDVKEPGFCAVLDVDLAAHGVIAFGENSWRGDYYEPTLRLAVKDWEASDERQ